MATRPAFATALHHQRDSLSEHYTGGPELINLVGVRAGEVITAAMQERRVASNWPYLRVNNIAVRAGARRATRVGASGASSSAAMPSPRKASAPQSSPRLAAR